MFARAARRNSQHSSTRRLLGVLVALWINMVLQPCAMASESEHDCPHCPPAHHEQMAAHHGHGHEKQAAPCAAFEAQCSDIGDISFETRSAAQQDDVDPPDILVAASAPVRATVAPDVMSRATGPPLSRLAAPPLYVLNCAYLK